MSETERRQGQAWIIHGVALALWVALYLYLFWDALFPAQKPAFDLAGFGAVIVGFALAIFAAIGTLVMVFVGRRPAVPLVMHGLVFAAWAVGSYVEQEDKRARKAEEAREEARREQERQPEGCLHARSLRVKGGKPRRAALTLANTCDDGVVVGDVTLVGFDQKGGNDIIDRWRQQPVAVPRGQTAMVEIEGDELQGGDPAIPLSRWAWRINVSVDAPRSRLLCFAASGAPERSGCAEIEGVEVVD